MIRLKSPNLKLLETWKSNVEVSKASHLENLNMEDPSLFHDRPATSKKNKIKITKDTI
jgi:hypothetical protein